ncbi:catalase family protein [Sphingobium sp.]|uniref:catalase family protein n=1 Tax=Sphingobium sp. TaxID=1912891 RepID=UPI002BCE0639|nr:catalase family protein [Sphingobium sp.]HUD93685.1 catalase family protein [Sphingobium sp.]
MPMTLPPPLPYSPEIETLQDDEGETLAAINASFDEILQTTHEDYGRAVRAVHAKAHGILEGIFTVADVLPPELVQGLFAAPSSHRAYLRISTNPGDILDDAVALPRGLALKVLDVEGERLPGAQGSTQDFIMVNGPIFTAPDAKKFAGNLKLLAKTTDRAEGAKVAASKVLQVVNAALGAVGMESTALAGLGGAPQVDPLGETYFSVTPFRYGEYVAKFRLRPVSSALTELTGAKIRTKGHPDAIRERVQQEMAGIDAEWAFEVQLRRDADRQPIEDASVEWKEDHAPFVEVARLRVPRQDSWDADRVRAVDEDMRFSVWTGLAAHRPLGGINRARRDAYQHSADFRAAANGCPMREPTT